MSAVASRATPARTGRRGSTYAFVLLTAASIAMLCVTAMLTQRLRTRVADRNAGGRTAPLLAMSAIEHALHTLESVSVTDPDPAVWRVALRSMNFSGSVDGGTIAWTFQNADGGQMSLDPAKTIYVVGVGTQGTASHSLCVAVRPSGPAYSSLELPLCAKDDLDLSTGTVVQADGTISSNDAVSADSSSIFADVESGGEIAGSTYHGATTPFAPVRGMPGTDVFDYYLANGTVIDESILPAILDDRFIEDVVISPASNPFGDVDAEGIYVVECGGHRMFIRNVRFLGTLVLVNPGAGSVISDSVCWSTPAPSAPALLVKGEHGIEIGLSVTDLVEAARGVNFNPAGTPYEGSEDVTLDDAYPSRIRGLVYSANQLKFRTPHTRITGTVLSGDNIKSDSGAVIELEYDARIAEDPPPGFFVPDGGVRVGAFTWERTPD